MNKEVKSVKIVFIPFEFKSLFKIEFICMMSGEVYCLKKIWEEKVKCLTIRNAKIIPPHSKSRTGLAFKKTVSNIIIPYEIRNISASYPLRRIL
jgi:hypothetical protein